MLSILTKKEKKSKLKLKFHYVRLINFLKDFIVAIQNSSQFLKYQSANFEIY